MTPFDSRQIRHYRDVLGELREQGMQPMVTLHHFTSPQWLADMGGWRNPDVIQRLADYTDHFARQTGDLVKWWITINEPSILGMKAYIEGSWPPFRPKDLRGYVRLMRNASRGHILARQVLKTHRRDAMVSMAFAFAARAFAMKVSPRSPAVALPSPMLS